MMGRVQKKIKWKKNFFQRGDRLARLELCVRIALSGEGREGEWKVLRFFYGKQGKFGEKIGGPLLANGRGKKSVAEVLGHKMVVQRFKCQFESWSLVFMNVDRKY